MAWTKTQTDQVLAEILKRSQRDAAFRQLCLGSPGAAVKQVAGEELPPGFKLRFVENNRADLTVVLPDPVSGSPPGQELSDGDLANLSGGVRSPNSQLRPGAGPQFGGSCFAAGTPVLMADGAWRPIEQVTVGSAVLSYDENLGRVTANLVTKVLHHAAEPIHRAVVEAVGHDLLLTTNHPFYSAGRWCAIRDLAPRAELFHFDFAQGEAPRRLLGLEATDRCEPVYNFEVERAHNYLVGGLLVHNGGIGNAK
jgi:hypothetical protein